jgi:hypothetical protein
VAQVALIGLVVPKFDRVVCFASSSDQRSMHANIHRDHRTGMETFVKRLRSGLFQVHLQLGVEIHHMNHIVVVPKDNLSLKRINITIDSFLAMVKQDNLLLEYKGEYFFCR